MNAIRVLLADDNPDDRLLATRSLRAEFSELATVEVGDEEGLQGALESGAFDALVTDYRLRFTDGLAVLRRIRERDPETVVVMFTATGSEELAVQAMHHGVDDYVLKQHAIRLGSAVRRAIERRVALRAAREVEQQYQRLFHEAPIGLARTNGEGRLLEVNRAFLRIFGADTFEQLAARDPLSFYVDPDDGARLRRLASMDLQRGLVLQMRRLDGSTCWVRSTGWSPGSGPSVWDFSVEDVTAERLLLESARESEERFRVLADATSLMIWVSDAQLRDTFLNRGWLEFSGKTYEDEEEDAWLGDVHPEDRERTFATYRDNAERRASFTQEYRILNRAGEYRSVVETAAPRIRPDGTFDGYVGVVFDVTEQLQAERDRVAAERLLDSTLEFAPLGVIVLDRDLRIVRMNGYMADLLATPAGDMVGSSADVVAGWFGTREQALAVALAVLESGRAVPDVEFRISTPAGERLLLVSVFPSHLPDGEPGVGVTAVDLTEMRRLQERGLQAQKLEAVGRFAAGIAHDFNNLLTAVDGNAALLGSGLGPSDPLTRPVAEIRRATQHGADLVRRLMGFTRSTPLESRPVDLGDVVRDVMSMLEPILPDPVSLVVDVRDGDATVLGDEGRVGQVVVNLALNGVDAMPAGGELTITVEPNEALVMLRVTDSGTGIAPDTLPFIWDPFFTTKGTDPESSAEPEGYGLGLPTVREILDELGATVDVESAPERGTTFTIAWPLAQKRERDVDDVPQPLTVAVGARLLVAEDNPLLRDLFSTVLEQAGHDVVAVEDGDAALEIVSGFDLIVADVSMPGLGGIELARTLAERGVETPVLLISGFAAEHLLADTSAAGFLQKPFTPAALTAKVAELLTAS